TTTSSVLDQLKDVYRPDGKLVVQTLYMEGEVMIGAKPNQDWFLTTFYPDFVQQVSAAGITPSLYFLVVADEAEVLDDTFVDGTYPELDGHRSMYWVYRSLRFMKDNGLPLPARMDASTYVLPTTSTCDVLVKRVYDDADATLVPLGMSGKYGVAETFYDPDSQAAQRRALGKAFADEALQRGRLEQLSFWTTPDSGGTGVDTGYPFAIADYQP
ncbi:MAG TPA: hypothetical protein VFF73_04755, partial [Planctomycetota bacterium]|nr:hypothetical protein [Planctomycetota bacterium]